MKLKIKQVPDAEPNVDGEWIEVDQASGIKDYRGRINWHRLSELCKFKHHAVAYEIVTDVEVD